MEFLFENVYIKYTCFFQKHPLAFFGPSRLEKILVNKGGSYLGGLTRITTDFTGDIYLKRTNLEYAFNPLQNKKSFVCWNIDIISYHTL